MSLRKEEFKNADETVEHVKKPNEVQEETSELVPKSLPAANIYVPQESVPPSNEIEKEVKVESKEEVKTTPFQRPGYDAIIQNYYKLVALELTSHKVLNDKKEAINVEDLEENGIDYYLQKLPTQASFWNRSTVTTRAAELKIYSEVIADINNDDQLDANQKIDMAAGALFDLEKRITHDSFLYSMGWLSPQGGRFNSGSTVAKNINPTLGATENNKFDKDFIQNANNLFKQSEYFKKINEVLKDANKALSSARQNNNLFVGKPKQPVMQETVPASEFKETMRQSK